MAKNDECRLMPRPMPKPLLGDEEYGTAACQNIIITDTETGRTERIGPWAPDPPDYVSEFSIMNSDRRFQEQQLPLIKKYRAKIGK